MSGPYRTAEKNTPFESYPVWMVCFCISYSCTRTKDVDFSLLWAVQFDKLHKTAAKGLQPGLARGMMGHIENSCTQGGYTMAERRFLLVDADVLPEVFVKVLQAKELLASGAVSNISAAAKQAGISRSAFYKYKDTVFDAETGRESITVVATLLDKTGALQGLLSGISAAGASIVTITQSRPENGAAQVEVTVRTGTMQMPVDEMLTRLSHQPCGVEIHRGA